ncbi:MAG: tripartite tricarboxylate transporter permease [Spirochaetales bacterium]|nr:tripartite tricarboxylate transporter permease [Spirochaetales bacterium]
MANSFNMLINGFTQALTPLNLAMAAIGTLVGTLVGVLPGLGAASAIAILIPVTAVLKPTQAIIMLAGIYYGAQYGGSTTSILLNIPGETASIPTCLDGFPMAKQGRGGPALGIAAIGSFIAGVLGVFGLAFFAPIFAEQALKFGPPEYFSLMILSLSIIVNFSGEFIIKGFIMGVLGYIISMVGVGITTGLPRLTFGSIALTRGFDSIAIIIGLFALPEVLKGMEEKVVAVSAENIGSIFPSKTDLKKSFWPILRGWAIGFFLGLLPGCSPAVSTFMSYDVEKKISKHPEQFGKGAIEGVAGPEAANNANSQAGFIPLFSFGIPASPALAVLLAGLMIYGLQPGPMLFQQNGGFVWAVIASMFIGNAMLIIFNLPLIGIWVRITRIPYGILGPIILFLCVIGAYSSRNSMFDVYTMIVFGLIGYFLQKQKWPIVPLVLCNILGPTLERAWIQSMAMSQDSLLIFVKRPISCGILFLTFVFIFLSTKVMRRTKKLATDAAGEDVSLTD